MRIRPLDPSSDALEPALGEAFERGLTRSERCFVADARDGRLAGLVAFGDPDDDGVVVVELLELPWDADHDGLGRRLLEESLAQLPERPAALWYLLDDPHPWHQRPEARKRLLESVGFEVARVTRRWERQGRVGPVADAISYRSLEEVGDAAFEAAVARVVEGSLDRRLHADDAHRQTTFLIGLEHDPGHYELAYEADGSLIGLIAAARVGSQPIVALLGVTPEHRGRGHALALLARATNHLAGAGERAIRADTDERNGPMARCFARLGYEQFATRTEYVRAQRPR